MTASQNLFRRHRNRDVEENDTPPVVAASGGQVTGEDVRSSSVDVTNSNSTTNNSDNDNDEEQELIVQVPNELNAPSTAPFVLQNMVVEPSEEARALRRETIRQEIERVQRANFIHFLVLCLVPTTLLVIVIIAIVSEDGDCSGGNDGLTVCEREARSFVNAFTSRCICDAIQSIQTSDVDSEENDEGL